MNIFVIFPAIFLHMTEKKSQKDRYAGVLTQILQYYRYHIPQVLRGYEPFNLEVHTLLVQEELLDTL